MTMKYVFEIAKVVEGALKGDTIKVVKYAEFLTKKLSDDGEVQSANVIKRILDNTKSPLKPKNFQTSVLETPVDTESRMPLAEIEILSPGDIKLVLPKEIHERINEFLNLVHKRDHLIENKIRVPMSMLLYGAPGTGKTQTARYIASQLGLPLVTARLDGMISSFLGSTAKNIRQLFDHVSKNPCILFIDEFDAIAKIRDAANEHGELKRVVNSLLQNIDAIRHTTPVIAATNHEQLLDDAVWRRFDYKIQLPLPDFPSRVNLIKTFQNGTVGSDTVELIAGLTEKMSGSDIESLMQMINANVALSEKNTVPVNDLLTYFLKYSKFQTKQNPSFGDERVMVKLLRTSNPRIFTQRKLAQLLGCSLGKINNILNEEAHNG